jgi:hypothetical protein
MHGSGADPESGAGPDDLGGRRLLAGGSELELGHSLKEVPRLVLLPMELERELLTCVHRQQLARVVLSEGPDQLVAPRLLDPLPFKLGEESRSATRRSSHYEPGVRLEVLLRAAQVLRRVDSQPKAFVAESAQAALAGELRKGGRLVVAALG